MDKYFFPTTGPENSQLCTKDCRLRPCKIGSVTCQQCEHCIDKGGGSEYFGPSWIKCKMLDDAVG